MADLDYLTAVELGAFVYEGVPCASCTGVFDEHSIPPIPLCWDHLQKLQFILEDQGFNPSQYRQEAPDA